MEAFDYKTAPYKIHLAIDIFIVGVQEHKHEVDDSSAIAKLTHVLKRQGCQPDYITAAIQFTQEAAAIRVSMQQVRPQLEQLIQEKFAFLVNDKDFTLMKPKQSVFGTVFNYKHLPSLRGLSLNLDVRDEYVDCYLIRLEDSHGSLPRNIFGSGPDGHRMGNSLRIVLQDFLHVEDDLLTNWDTNLRKIMEAHPGRGDLFAEALLQNWSTLTERYLDRLLHEPIEALFAVPNQ